VCCSPVVFPEQIFPSRNRGFAARGAGLTGKCAQGEASRESRFCSWSLRVSRGRGAMKTNVLPCSPAMQPPGRPTCGTRSPHDRSAPQVSRCCILQKTISLRFLRSKMLWRCSCVSTARKKQVCPGRAPSYLHPPRTFAICSPGSAPSAGPRGDRLQVFSATGNGTAGGSPIWEQWLDGEAELLEVSWILDQSEHWSSPGRLAPRAASSRRRSRAKGSHGRGRPAGTAPAGGNGCGYSRGATARARPR
jgi:hypothetical protein